MVRRQLRLEVLECRDLLSITVTGLHHEQIKISDPGDGAVIDLTGGTFPALEDTHFPLGEPLPSSWPARYTYPEWESSNDERYPVTIKGTSSNVVINGGEIYGMMDDRAPWHVWKNYSDGDGLRVEGKGTYEIKNTFIQNVEDGIGPRGSVGTEFYIHDVYMNQIHDDMIENDDVHSGVIANSYLRGHTFLSARDGSVTDPLAVVQIKNSVVELMLQPHMGDQSPNDINTAGGYPYPDGLGNGSIFKWAGTSGTVDVRDSVFLINRHATSSNSAMEFAPGTYQNVTVVWLGNGDYPWPAPEGVTITRDRTIYDRAVQEFFATHDVQSTVVGRFLFYDNSSFDGNVAGVSASDDAAIATDKSAYLPGGTTAVSSNLSSYSRGINGIMVDLAPGGSHTSITASDFIFKVGNNNSPSTWDPAPAPSAVSVRLSAGVGGSDRVEITWATGVIKNTWLEVQVLPTSNTGLSATDVFFWGNKVGDATYNRFTNAQDVGQIAANFTTAGAAAIDNPRDVNRNKVVNTQDLGLAANAFGNIVAINFTLSPPALSAALANDTGPGGVPNGDGITQDPTIGGTLTGVHTITSFLAGLNGGPLTTDVLPLVQPDGSFTISPALLDTMNGSPLPDGNHVLHLRADDAEGLTAVLDVPFTLDTVAPTVGVSTLVTFGDDLTPHVTVTASDTLGLANGTPIRLDVDVNNDGDFDDANELNRTLSTLYNGSRYFELTPALPPTNPIDGAYLVQLRARVTDIAGNEGISPLTSHKIDTLPKLDALGNTVLASYINNDDTTYSVTAAATPTIDGEDLTGDAIKDYTVHVFDLKSQTWRTTADVINPATGTAVWQHWLQIIVPTTVTESTALLKITGGSTGSQPTTLNDDRKSLGQFSFATGMISVLLPTVPNQALHFTDEAAGVNRSEDDIIAYTFDKFVDNLGAPGNETWLALLPMVKSAVRAMDAVQLKDTTLPGGIDVNDFIVTGGSKRGWTTWLTGATDSRVKAVIPGVIDMLNIDESFVHHYGFYGFFAPAVQDYQENGFNLIQNSLMPANQEIGRIVDPYRYLDNSNLTNIPKLLLNSTGDEFFVPDSAQFYYSDIPGTKYLRYIPNTGHGLSSGPGDTRAADSSLTFTNAVVNNLTLPQYSWTIDPDGAIRVQTSSSPTSVLLWQATNGSTRDFRNAYTGLLWSGTSVAPESPGVYVANVDTPVAPAARAFMIELTFTSPIVGKPYVFTTEVRVVSNVALTPWPFFMPANAPGVAIEPLAGSGGVSGIPNEDQNLLLFGLAVDAALVEQAPSRLPSWASLPADATLAEQVDDGATELLFDDWPWIDEVLGADDAADDATNGETIDLVLAGLDEDLSL